MGVAHPIPVQSLGSGSDALRARGDSRDNGGCGVRRSPLRIVASDLWRDYCFRRRLRPPRTIAPTAVSNIAPGSGQSMTSSVS